MPTYKHTQIGYLMIVITLLVLGLFAWVHFRALQELPSVDSGPNFLITSMMVLILAILASFSTLTTSVDTNFLRVKFGYGLFSKKFALGEIARVQRVLNRWYYGWGVKVWFWPYMWIYNVSGFDAVEIVMKDGRIFRIGTDAPNELETALKQATHL